MEFEFRRYAVNFLLENKPLFRLDDKVLLVTLASILKILFSGLLGIRGSESFLVERGLSKTGATFKVFLVGHFAARVAFHV